MKIIKRLSIIVTIVVKYKIIKPLVFFNDNVRQCLTIGGATSSVAHTIYNIVEHCHYCR